MKKMAPGETARTIMFVIPTAGLDGTADDQRAALVSNLEGRAQVKKWALALHDGDDPSVGGSGASGPHWQGVLQTAKDLPASRFESWLPGCEPLRKLEGGRDALLDGVHYLTHENQPEKAQYSRSSILASPGWDWEAELRDREVKAAVRDGGKGRSKVVASVLDGGLTVLEARRRGASNERALWIARHQHLASLGSENLPAVRVNFYLQLPSTQHPGGVRLAEALARTLSADQRAYRMIGSKVDDYDGEDVLLMTSELSGWSEPCGESRVWTQRGPLGGMRELLAILRSTPAPHTLPTRYSPTQLVHRHTVITGTEPFDQLRADLERGYKMVIATDAREQSFLSLPVFVPVSADEFSVQVSARFALGRGELDQFVQFEQVRLGIAEALEKARRVHADQRQTVVQQIEQRQTRQICAAGAKVADHLGANDALSADEVLAELADLGHYVRETASGSLTGTPKSR